MILTKIVHGFKCLLCPILVITLLFTSCQKENTSELKEQTVAKQENTTDAGEKLIAVLHEKGILERLAALEAHSDHHHHSAPSKARSSHAKKDLLHIFANNEHIQEYRNLIKRAINPDDFDCGPTFLNEYILKITKEFTPLDFQLIDFYGFIVPLYEAAFFDNTPGGDSFGKDGEFTSSMQKTYIEVKRFWDIPTDIQLVDMHGTVFKNVPLLTEVLKFVFAEFDENGNLVFPPDEEMLALAQALKGYFGAAKFDNYNHPLFTFNAVAIAGIPELGVGKKIVMGDGVMQAYRELGFGTIAEKFILAHEYGHHIQFANDYIPPGPDTPEETRRIELMADAYAAYFMAHGRGLFIQINLIKRFVETSYSIGDCAFDSPGHHGTPNQRRRAAALGGRLAEQKTLIDSKLSGQEFFEAFQAAYPELIVPDAN